MYYLRLLIIRLYKIIFKHDEYTYGSHRNKMDIRPEWNS